MRKLNVVKAEFDVKQTKVADETKDMRLTIGRLTESTKALTAQNKELSAKHANCDGEIKSLRMQVRA